MTAEPNLGPLGLLENHELLGGAIAVLVAALAVICIGIRASYGAGNPEALMGNVT